MLLTRRFLLLPHRLLPSTLIRVTVPTSSTNARFLPKPRLNTRRHEHQLRHTANTSTNTFIMMKENASSLNAAAAVGVGGGKKAIVAQTDSEAVREFTGGAGQPIPNEPAVMSTEEVDFIGKMILDEVMELFATGK